MKIYFVTGNPGKLREAKSILGIEVESIDIDLEEIQSLSFEDVIVHKVKQAYEQTKIPVMVEDSGIIFHALGDLPGVFTKWFVKSIGMLGMVRLLKDFSDMSATAISYVGYYDGKKLIIEKGEVKGVIVEPRGEGGFGWDPIFQPDGQNKTFGEMDAETKNSLSMRKIALENLKAKMI